METVLLEKNKILAFIIKEKNVDNILLCTVRGLAKTINVSQGTVSGIFKLLIKKGFLKKVLNGQYMVSPSLLRHGSKTRGAMLLRLWNE